MTSQTTRTIEAAIADADARGSKWLADANEARESGKIERAEKFYSKGQFWLDRSNELRERLFVVRHSST